MTEPQARVVYEFNDFRLDPQQRLLLTSGGEPIPLAPKVFDTLLYFIERRGELLDKSVLMKAVWPNVVVEENSLNQNISALRRALKEGPSEHRYIVTEPGRGYRFVADVRAVTAEGPAAPAARSSTPASSRKSIAVLPFVNLTGDPGKDYLGDGLAEELIHTLARIPNLRVPSRTSAFAYKGRNVDLRQIARDLDVAAVLEGSVRTAGDRIRVTAQLIDGDTGFHRWSQSYDRDMGDLFRLQDELASAIVATLRVSLNSGMPGTVLQVTPTQNIEAYHLYLQAMAMQATPNPAAIERAIDMLRRALALDPRFARAHSGLASLRAIGIVMDARFPDRLDDIEQDALRALALDPDTGTTYGAIATIQAARGQWVDAESAFQTALRLDPEDPYLHQSYGVFLAGSVGYSARFLEVELRAHRLAPAWIVNLMATAVAYYTVDRPVEARRYIELAVDLGIYASAGPIPDLLAQLDVRDGQHEAAKHRFDPSLISPDPALGVRETIGCVFDALAGKAAPAAAVAALDELLGHLDRERTTQLVKRRFIVWYTQLGALTQAFEIANQALDQFERGDTIGTAWSFLWMPELRAFRQDERFQALVTRLKLPAYWDQFGPPDNCDWRNGRLICR